VLPNVREVTARAEWWGRCVGTTATGGDTGCEVLEKKKKKKKKKGNEPQGGLSTPGEKRNHSRGGVATLSWYCLVLPLLPWWCYLFMQPAVLSVCLSSLCCYKMGSRT
jgi:hypothetical protein